MPAIVVRRPLVIHQPGWPEPVSLMTLGLGAANEATRRGSLNIGRRKDRVEYTRRTIDLREMSRGIYSRHVRRYAGFRSCQGRGRGMPAALLREEDASKDLLGVFLQISVSSASSDQ